MTVTTTVTNGEETLEIYIYPIFFFTLEALFLSALGSEVNVFFDTREMIILTSEVRVIRRKLGLSNLQRF